MLSPVLRLTRPAAVGGLLAGAAALGAWGCAVGVGAGYGHVRREFLVESLECLLVVPGRRIRGAQTESGVLENGGHGPRLYMQTCWEFPQNH